MTVLVGVHHPEKGTVIGCDQRVSNGLWAGNIPTKLTAGYGWVVGAAGHLRTINILQHYAEDLLRDLETPMQFTDRIASLLKEMNYTPVGDKHDVLKSNFQNFLLANAHGVWDIDDSLAITSAAPNQILATGSGYQYALGQAYANRHLKDPVARVQQAIEAACHYDPSCGGEPQIITIKMEKKSS